MTPPLPNRFGAFFSRVETEREVLAVVNDVVSGPKLHGLTEAAIDRWAARLDATTSGPKGPLNEIVQVLHRIAIRAAAHADQSRVVFASEVVDTLPVHDLVGKLQALCRDWAAMGRVRQ